MALDDERDAFDVPRHHPQPHLHRGPVSHVVPPLPDGDYLRGRVDALIDARMSNLEHEVDQVRDELRELARNVYRLMGALGVLVVLAQIIVPLLQRAANLPS